MNSFAVNTHTQTNTNIHIHTGEHDNGVRGKLELVDKEIAHALGVVDAPLELMRRVPVRYPAYNRPLPPVRVRNRPPGRLAVGRRSRRRRLGSGGEERSVGRRRRQCAGIGHVGDSLADGAADGSGALRKLERVAAVGTVDQHKHGRFRKLQGSLVSIQGLRFLVWNSAKLRDAKNNNYKVFNKKG